MCTCRQIIAVAQASILPDSGEQLILEYYIRQYTGAEDEILYGLRVDKRSTEGVLIEREETPALTGSLQEATSLAERFAAGTVPPCTLLELVDEWHEAELPSSVHATGKEYITFGS